MISLQRTVGHVVSKNDIVTRRMISFNDIDNVRMISLQRTVAHMISKNDIVTRRMISNI